MSEWKECKLGELVSLEYGKSLSGYQESNGKYPVYGTNGRIGNTDSFLSPMPSIIIGRKGAYRGVHFSQYPFYVIDTAFYVKPKAENLVLLFLYNFLLTQDINAMDSGSAIPSTDRYEIYDLDILLPPLPEQRAIASVLSSLDDKIDLLHRQNKTLEGMADALWRKMFVEKADEGWEEEIGNLPIEIIDGDRGVNYPKNSEFSSNGYCLFLSAQNVTSTGFKFNECSFITKEKDEILRSGKLVRNDIVLTTRGTVGNIAFYHNLIPFDNIRINSE
jgi:type I restriction enzyme S subunit